MTTNRQTPTPISVPVSTQGSVCHTNRRRRAAFPALSIDRHYTDRHTPTVTTLTVTTLTVTHQRLSWFLDHYTDRHTPTVTHQRPSRLLIRLGARLPTVPQAYLCTTILPCHSQLMRLLVVVPTTILSSLRAHMTTSMTILIMSMRVMKMMNPAGWLSLRHHRFGQNQTLRCSSQPPLVRQQDP